MLSLARVCFLAVSLSLLFNASLAANLQYSIYNGTACSGSSLTSGTDNGASYQSSNGQSVWVGSCVPVSGVSGILSAKLGCSSGTVSISNGAFYTQAGCTGNLAGAAQNQTAGSGSCSTIVTASSSLSVGLQCNSNGAFAMAALSLPLMALLALVASFSM